MDADNILKIIGVIAACSTFGMLINLMLSDLYKDIRTMDTVHAILVTITSTCLFAFILVAAFNYEIVMKKL